MTPSELIWHLLNFYDIFWTSMIPFELLWHVQKLS
jgi:hypothetical protein